MSKQACSEINHLSKKALLSILELSYIPKYKLVDCQSTEATPCGTTFVETKHFLAEMDEDLWDIISFDPKSRRVCVRITTNTGYQNISLTLPIY